MNKTFHLRIWRQPHPTAPGKLISYTVTNTSPNTSFLEMLDILNQQLITQGDTAIEFDSDCREGICRMPQRYLDC